MLSRLSMISRAIPSTASKFSPIATFKRNYHENVIDHYENPRNVGSLDIKDSSVGTGKYFFSRIFVSFFCDIRSFLVSSSSCSRYKVNSIVDIPKRLSPPSFLFSFFRASSFVVHLFDVLLSIAW